MVEKGRWVRIKKIVLEAGQRADRLPEETRNVPFITWVKGTLISEGNIGQEVTVKTKSGRIETGELVEADPFYEINYGEYVHELSNIGDAAREILFGGGERNE